LQAPEPQLFGSRSLFDHLVGERENVGRYFEAHRLRRLEIEDQGPGRNSVRRLRIAARISVIPSPHASVHDPEHADSGSRDTKEFWAEYRAALEGPREKSLGAVKSIRPLSLGGREQKLVRDFRRLYF
jgi:hypothetical protein